MGFLSSLIIAEAFLEGAFRFVAALGFFFFLPAGRTLLIAGGLDFPAACRSKAEIPSGGAARSFILPYA
jgi:hypothetical protein